MTRLLVAVSCGTAPRCARGAAANSVAMTPVGTRKARLLALHGFTQDAQTFRSRIGSMRKGLKSRADFVFVDAPHMISDVSDEVVASAGGQSAGRSWWAWEGGERPSQSATYKGWEPSLEAITAAMAAEAPVDGLMGFSQGATAAALYLSGLQDAGQQMPRFAILVGGFLPRDPAYAAAITKSKICIPTLHIYGQGDKLVSTERSKALMGAFDSELAEVYEHPGGHMVPTCTGEFKRVICDFVDLCASAC
mmetsp:Transcript_6014/g.15745  ORF Transcript_6014/g.15745 Transcript_6014/m.15745 type:complete len:250 (+) Transcript_6014:139-888(+)